MAGSNMDIVADSCKSLVDQFLQEREPTALAEGRIVAVIDPHNNLMNQFLNEQEPTAPPVDGMNVDLLKQLLNAWEPSALPVTHKKLNRMDKSSTPAQDITMQVDFLADLQNVWELSPLPITCESSNLRDRSPRPDSLTNLLAQLQDMREPMPPPLISNVNFHPHSNLFKWNNGDWHLFHDAIKSCMPYMLQYLAIAETPLPATHHSIPPLIGTLCGLQMPLQENWAQLQGTSMPFIASQSHPSRQSVVEMGILYLACQIEVASVHLKQTANIMGWPAHWSTNLAMDLNQLNSLILVMVLHASYTPPLLACYHAYLRHQDDEDSFCNQMQLIPLSAFSIINNISTIIPHWTPHTADPNSSFAFPWWLYHSEEYAADSQRLQCKGLFSVAWDFFKLMMAQGLWPLPEAPITDCLDGHIKEQKYANVVNGWG
ncbi:hypothetical protein F5J12DRAFT_786911 [Pisolithus orientalis]|uniref:uncharacterized protein n=1 Tax=Pisolithus orientalis TaxID=936130 RepID=UPI00222594BE|nr:uncharacterized protein F5J12DRAFT_786911 [Pisolithus orientalis]KAI5988247.1 hypothetical protein F5J12DRAFT_786911 [Pisolithus orientalis]